MQQAGVSASACFFWVAVTAFVAGSRAVWILVGF